MPVVKDVEAWIETLDGTRPLHRQMTGHFANLNAVEYQVGMPNKWVNAPLSILHSLCSFLYVSRPGLSLVLACRAGRRASPRALRRKQDPGVWQDLRSRRCDHGSVGPHDAALALQLLHDRRPEEAN